MQKWLKFLTAVIFVVPFIACSGGSSGGTDGKDGKDGESLYSLISTMPEPAGPNCLYGGYKIMSGLDADGNKILDTAEATSTQYMCSSAPSASSSSGLVKTSQEPAGANCQYGGHKIMSGLDTNGNGTLEAPEITDTQYICSSAPAAPIYSSLVKTDQEPAGANCQYGGHKIMSGLDTNGNGTLEAPEITDTQYICSSAPAAPVYSGLVNTAQEPAGANCQYGGISIMTGMDTNSNGILDASEVTSTEYICSSKNSGTELLSAYSENGRIYGTMKPGRSLFARLFTSGGDDQLILVPDNISLAVDTDDGEKGPDGGQSTPRTITSPVYINIADNGTYSIDNLTTGTYMLIFIDNATEKGYQIKVTVSPDGSVRVDKDITKAAPLKTNVDVKVTENNPSLTPITGAVVKVLENSNTFSSDAAGIATVTRLTSGEYTFRVSAAGYIPQDIKYNTADGGTPEAALDKIITAGSISGMVTISDNVTDYSNAIVYLKSADGSLYSALVDADGTWRIGNIPADSGYSVTAWAHDFTGGKADGLTVTAGNNTDAGTIALTRIPPTQGIISGFARYADRAGLNHAGIIVAVEGTDFEAITARDGSFVINNIPAGRYTVNAIESSYQTTTIEAVRVVGGGITALTDISMKKRTGMVKGVAKLSGTNNHSGILVTAAGTDYNTTTDANGLWTLHLPLGNYAGGIMFSKKYFKTGITLNTFTVTEDGAYNIAEILLVQESAGITGMLAIDGVSDCTGAVIELSGASSGVIATVNPKADCSYTIDGLPFGDYYITVSFPGNRHETYTGPVTADNSTTTVTLPTINLRTGYVKINNGMEYTKSRTVSLEVGSSAATRMMITGDLTGGGVWINYEKTRSISLTEGDGVKNIMVSLQNDTQNFSDVTSSIKLDTAAAITSFTADGATKKGDTIRFRLNAGETGGKATVTVPGLYPNLILYDNGLNGDTAANDGIYERTMLITTAGEVDAYATATFTDKAGNTATADSAAKVVLATPPTISSVSVSSSLASGDMTVSFVTDEPATANIEYGTTSAYGSGAVVSSTNKLIHLIRITGLTANTMYYFKITAADVAGNARDFTGSSKLAPDAPEGFAAAAGNAETGMAWKAAAGDILGYNIYRATESGAFSKLNSVPVTALYYVDKSVSNGISYSYKVESVDSDNNPSNPTQAVAVKPLASLAGPTEMPAGIIDRATIWLSSRSPYNISGSNLVRNNAIIYILPGTAVNISYGSKLEVYGTIKSYGAEDSKVALLGPGTIELNDSLYNYSSTETGLGRADYYWTNIGSILTTTMFDYGLPDHNIYNSDILLPTEEMMDSDNGINTAKDSVIRRHVNIKTGDNLTIEGAGSSITTLTNSLVKNSSVSGTFADNVTFENSTASFNNAVNSVFNKSKFTGSTVSYSSFDGTSTASNATSAKYNYWGTADYYTVRAKVRNTTILHPVITGPDFDTADFDGDGIPDCIDWDNDNDGYSDAQEWKESRPNISFYYNPLDHESYPNVVNDMDVDGIPDDDDTDNDNDGLPDDDEAALGTHPYMADSDGDGVNDYMEVTLKYDPLDGNNCPLSGNKTNMVIDGSNVNDDGNVYTNGLTCRYCTVNPGIMLYTAGNTAAGFYNSAIAGAKNNPVYTRGKISIYNSEARYLNHASGTFTAEHSTVEYSDIASYIFYGTSVSHSALFGAGYHDSEYGYYLTTVIKNSYISGAVSNAQYHNSYINNGQGYQYDSISSISSSYVANIVPANDMWGELFIYRNLSITSSIIDNFYSSQHAAVKGSDVKNMDSTVLWGSPTILNAFFNGCHISDYNGNSYTGYGSPADGTGDKKITTLFTIDGVTYRVDGITNPQSAKHFPNFVRNPAVASEFWNPTGVGCLWNPAIPNTFPTQIP